MEKSKKYRMLVKQVHRFSNEFSVSATSEAEARSIVGKMIDAEPLDGRKNTYQGTDITVEVLNCPIQVHTVEELFDIDKDISDEEVILLDDLSENQKGLLGLVHGEGADESLDTFFVLSSGGSLKVEARTGLVIECATDRNEVNELTRIARFDLQEYKEHYHVSQMPGHLDILDLGYWNKDGGYEKPVEDWRNEMRKGE